MAEDVEGAVVKPTEWETGLMAAIAPRFRVVVSELGLAICPHQKTKKHPTGV